MAPALVARGYPPANAAAIVAGVSMLDNIIPPSIAFLILASATNLSVGSLLVGGFDAEGDPGHRPHQPGQRRQSRRGLVKPAEFAELGCSRPRRHHA